MYIERFPKKPNILRLPSMVLHYSPWKHPSCTSSSILEKPQDPTRQPSIRDQISNGCTIESRRSLKPRSSLLLFSFTVLGRRLSNDITWREFRPVQNNYVIRAKPLRLPNLKQSLPYAPFPSGKSFIGPGIVFRRFNNFRQLTFLFRHLGNIGLKQARIKAVSFRFSSL